MDTCIARQGDGEVVTAPAKYSVHLFLSRQNAVAAALLLVIPSGSMGFVCSRTKRQLRPIADAYEQRGFVLIL